MKVKDYFKLSAVYLCKTFTMLGKGIVLGLRHLFKNYPNPTWAVITATVILFAFIKIGQARSERDQYSKRTAQLQLQLDSCLQEEIKYINK